MSKNAGTSGSIGRLPLLGISALMSLAFSNVGHAGDQDRGNAHPAQRAPTQRARSDGKDDKGNKGNQGQPSSQPAGQPSSQPSSQPAGQPSSQPSSQPAGQGGNRQPTAPRAPTYRGGSPAPQVGQGGQPGQNQGPNTGRTTPRGQDSSGSSSSSPTSGSGQPTSGSGQPNNGSGQPSSGSPQGGSSSHAPPQQRGGGDQHQRPQGGSPQGGTRSYNGGGHGSPPPNHSNDHRYARPESNHVRPAQEAGRPPPQAAYYRPYYTRYYVHPYYRYEYATFVVVSFGFAVYPYTVTWAPPMRAGWVWVGGSYDPYGRWIPGYWAPASTRAGYAYVPGYWQNGIYIEGYYRAPTRHGWSWVDGYYVADGGYVPGYWQPQGQAPAGYTWEAGFFDGDAWVEGFWRPQYRNGYTWVSAYFDDSGVYNAGYWQPTEDRPGYTWVPGWFDGEKWVEGYWVTNTEYQQADPSSWSAPEGWNDGWDTSQTSAPANTGVAPSRGETVAPSAAPSASESAPVGDDMPLAVPVDAP